MRAPIIGICSAYEQAQWSFWDMPAAVVGSTYLNHVAHGGAVPLAFVPSKHTIDNAPELIGRVDGLLLLGGADVDPSQYGEAPDSMLEATVPVRDATEIALLRAALNRGTPVLGICRGLHIMNVATGGTLTQDIGNLGLERHRRVPGRLDSATFHPITTEPHSLVNRIFGDSAITNSHHHQAVNSVGEGGWITARSSEDGVIEAIEWNSPNYAVGVQWHPEAGEMGGIIGQFLTACSRFDVSHNDSGVATPTLAYN